MRGGRVTDWLTAAVVATYVLLAFGAVVAASGPSGGAWIVLWPEPTVGGVTAVAHRLAAAITGGIVFGAAIQAHRHQEQRAVRWLLATAVVAFVVQVAVGAVVATDGPALIARLHLPLGVATLLVLVGALVRALDDRMPTAEANPLAVDNGDGGPVDGTPATATGAGGAPASRGERADDEKRGSRSERGDGAEEDTSRSEQADGAEEGWLPVARAYVRLTKPRLLWLLCLLAAAGMALAAIAGSPPSGLDAVATLGGGVLAVGASGVANHLYERDRDRRMDRTADRPLAQDRVSARGAALFCAALTVGALAIPALVVSTLVAALIGSAICYYAVVYTVLLKPTTRWSTLIGGGAGALPAVIGWAAGTGSIGLPGVLLAGVVVCWTPAHFYNLAIAYREDYARGGFPLVPVVEGVATARRRIVGYLVATLLAAGLLGIVADLGIVYVFAVGAGGAIFLAAVVEAARERTDASALRAFHASNAFLGLLLCSILVEAALASGTTLG